MPRILKPDRLGFDPASSTLQLGKLHNFPLLGISICKQGINKPTPQTCSESTSQDRVLRSSAP